MSETFYAIRRCSCWFVFINYPDNLWILFKLILTICVLTINSLRPRPLQDVSASNAPDNDRRWRSVISSFFLCLQLLLCNQRPDTVTLEAIIMFRLVSVEVYSLFHLLFGSEKVCFPMLRTMTESDEVLSPLFLGLTAPSA